MTAQTAAQPMNSEDISSVGFWSQTFEERDETFARLRRDAPVSFHPPLETPELAAEIHGEKGFWAVVLAEDLEYVSKHHELFSSDETKWGVGSVMLRPNDPSMAERPTFLSMDPPLHGKYRRIMSSVFRPRAVARLNGLIEQRAQQIVSQVTGKGEFDFVSEVSAKLPMMTVADMIGFPESLVDEFAETGDKALHYYRPEVNGGEDPLIFRMRHLERLRDMGIEVIEHRRRHPQDDIATALATAQIDDSPLDADEIQSIMILLAVAGNDTTRNTTTHTVHQLWRNPDQRAWLMEDFDERIASAVDEFLRHACPVNSFARTATTDVELRGQQIREGDRIGIFYASANRDEALFDEPHRFDLKRAKNTHFAFGGGGVHFCLGSGVAKAQLTALMRQIPTTLPHMAVGEPTYLQSDFINGIERLPVTA